MRPGKNRLQTFDGNKLLLSCTFLGLCHAFLPWKCLGERLGVSWMPIFFGKEGIFPILVSELLA